jgi:hypothetical protein
MGTRELQRHGGEPCHRRRHWYTDCNLAIPIAGTVLLRSWKDHVVASKLDGQHVVNGSAAVGEKSGWKLEKEWLMRERRPLNDRRLPVQTTRVSEDRRVRATS